MSEINRAGEQDVSPTARPRTIIFDLSEVLIAGILGIEQALAARLNCDVAAVLGHFGGEHLDDLCRGKLVESEYLAKVLARSGWHLKADDLAAMLRTNFTRKVEGTEALVHRLTSDYELVLLSDHSREWIAAIDTLHALLTLFHRRIYSFEIGLLKRDPDVWTKVLTLLQREARECLFIDDSAINVACAQKQGLAAIRFVSASDLEQQLVARGILANAVLSRGTR